MSFQFVQASVSTLAQLDLAGVRELIHGLERKGRKLLLDSGLSESDCRVRVSAAIALRGPGFEVEVPVASIDGSEWPAPATGRRIRPAVTPRCTAVPKRTRPAEIVSWRVVVQGPTPELTPTVAGQARERCDGLATVPGSARKVRGWRTSAAQGRFVETQVYDRYGWRRGPEWTDRSSSRSASPPW